jgi:nucleoside-diphosphate-sugar epimerase
MKYILSGSKGLIGEYLKDRLNQRSQCVMEFDIRQGSNILNIDGIRLNPKTQKTDIFIHTAAHCKINEGIEHPILPHSNNCNGIYRVLEFCLNNEIPRIMNFSSSRVLSPQRNPYVASKIYGEELTKAFGE